MKKQNQLNVYKQKQRKLHYEIDSCPGDGDSSLPELGLDCLDLFTWTAALLKKSSGLTFDPHNKITIATEST